MIQIHLEPEIEARLVAEARARGLSAERYVEQLITALRRLVARDVEFCFTLQNLGEFWNVSTRPVEHNGFGLSIQETDAHVQSIERTMTLLPEDERVYPT